MRVAPSALVKALRSAAQAREGAMSASGHAGEHTGGGLEELATIDRNALIHA